jgi:hypothetical protein
MHGYIITLGPRPLAHLSPKIVNLSWPILDGLGNRKGWLRHLRPPTRVVQGYEKTRAVMGTGHTATGTVLVFHNLGYTATRTRGIAGLNGYFPAALSLISALFS